jgi:hypothetical protein
VVAIGGHGSAFILLDLPEYTLLLAVLNKLAAHGIIRPLPMVTGLFV